jgi:Flp pilus assembly protein TadG
MTRPQVGARLGGERGSLSLELVVLAPAILLILALVIAGGRMALASQAVAQAASQAARDASLQPTVAAATSAARSRAASVLDGQGLGCAPRSVTVNAAAVNGAPGVPGAVRTRVECTVRWTDLGIPGPGSRTLRADGSAPVDTWTSR